MSHYNIWKDSQLYKGHPDQWFGPYSYSTCGEDLMITQLFWLMGITKPSYLDIGAHHPFTLSNTALLYSRGSTGVNVEANPSLMFEFYKHRPKDINVNMGVSPKGGTMRFYMWDDTSGRNTFSESAAKKLEVFTKEISLPTVTLDEILWGKCNGVFPDLLSMDIEGMDYEVLNGADLSYSRPKVICVEVTDDTPQFVEMMKLKGFIPVCRMAANIIFLAKECAKICQIPG